MFLLVSQFFHSFSLHDLTFIFFSQVNAGLLALATPREVQEMDISLLLELPSWLEDECEFDIINLNK